LNASQAQNLPTLPNLTIDRLTDQVEILRTIHHVFDIPFEIDQYSSSYMKLNSKKAKIFIKH